MNECIVVFDIGTSGLKTAVFRGDGSVLDSIERPYPTFFPRIGWHEQKPQDWWDAIAASTREIVEKNAIRPESVSGIAVSGHMCGVIPMDASGKLLRESVPIWSDVRADRQAKRLTERVGERHYYDLTGKDAPEVCSVSKIMWYADNEPELLRQADVILGTKDYINYLLTGCIATDPSYASGSGVHDINTGGYSDELLEAAGFSGRLMPEILPSAQVIGHLTAAAAQALGLSTGTRVVCGGADTCCMALGAGGVCGGRAQTSLGSSAFVTMTTDSPALNYEKKQAVFSHVVPDVFLSTRNLHSAGSAFKWLKNVMCEELAAEAEEQGRNVYSLMTELAAQSPVGANRLIFNPTLALGGPLDKSVNTRGAFSGLDLKHEKKDLIRAAMEGIALNLGWNLNVLREMHAISGEMLLIGGGSKSDLWMQIFADVYDMSVFRMAAGQHVGALGAAALAAVGTGLWAGCEKLGEMIRRDDIKTPNCGAVEKYKKLMEVYQYVAVCQADIGDRLAALDM